jgi:hypothetical protein
MKLVPIICLAALVATPAFAAGPRKKLPRHSYGYFEQQRDWRDSRNAYRGDYLRGPNVYSPSGRYVGRDPSPNVRQRMYDDDLRFRGQF